MNNVENNVEEYLDYVVKNAPHTISAKQREINAIEEKERLEACRFNRESMQLITEPSYIQKKLIKKAYNEYTSLDFEGLKRLEKKYSEFSLKNIHIWFTKGVIIKPNICAWTFIGICRRISEVLGVEAEIIYLFGQNLVQITVK